MKPKEAKNFSEWCIAIREREGVPQAKFAKQLKLSTGYVGQMEIGFYTKPFNYLEAVKKYVSKPELKHGFDLLTDEIWKGMNK